MGIKVAVGVVLLPGDSEACRALRRLATRAASVVLPVRIAGVSGGRVW